MNREKPKRPKERKGWQKRLINWSNKRFIGTEKSVIILEIK